MKNLSDVMQWRHTAKHYDTTKKISAEDFQSLKDVLRLSPSSTNLQPWHFVIADDEAGKERITKGTEGYHDANTAKIKEASHVIVLCSLADVNEDYLEQLLQQEDADGRFAKPKDKKNMDDKRKKSVNNHRYHDKDEVFWLAQQSYITMGALLLGAATLGIDATPMEGVNFEALDEALDLNSKGYTSVAVVCLGYHSEKDYNAELPKSRLSEAVVFSKA